MGEIVKQSESGVVLKVGVVKDLLVILRQRKLAIIEQVLCMLDSPQKGWVELVGDKRRRLWRAEKSQLRWSGSGAMTQLDRKDTQHYVFLHAPKVRSTSLTVIISWWLWVHPEHCIFISYVIPENINDSNSVLRGWIAHTPCTQCNRRKKWLEKSI